MNVLICFEVTGKQEQVRKELASKGYMPSWKVTRGRDVITYNLPSNAMWKKGDSMTTAKAKEDLKKATTQAGVKTIRAMALVISKWDGIPGEEQDVLSGSHSEA